MSNIPLTVNGFRFQMEMDHDFVVQSLFRGEVWETTALRAWSEQCKTVSSSGIIFDVGAYTGIYALLAATASPLPEIHAFEPLDTVFHRLQMNVQTNGMKHRITTHHKALSDIDGEITFKVTGGSVLPSGSSVEDHPTRPLIRESTVQCIRGDVAVRSTRKVELVKIDVERHEYSVLRGMERILTEDRPVVFMEILEQEEAKKIFALMDAYGYKSVELICEDLKHTVKDDRIWEPMTDRTNYIFRP